MGTFDSTTSFAIILLAALIHASFQLSISVLTLLSGHALGRKTAHRRLLRLTSGFMLGAGIMTVMLLSVSALILSVMLPDSTPASLWALVCGAVIGVGISVWLFYYRSEKGTSLWIPRGFAEYLHDRTKATRVTAESFALGLVSVIAELLFIFAPLLVTALLLVRMEPDQQLLGIIGYSVISLTPLIVVGLLIGNGRKLSHIQRWRESNKRFLQFAAGSGLLVLGAYVYVEQVINASASAMGGR